MEEKTMAIKMRVLCYPENNKKLHTIAEMIKAEYDLNVNSVDRIPPAYSCDKERLVVLLASVSKDPANALILFCKELTKVRTANVAFIIDGPKEGADVLINAVKEAGANVIDDILYIKGGIPFLGGVKDEEKKTVTDWMDKISANLA